MARAVGWSPDNLIIDRFGLDYDFIERHGLTWIENLATSKGEYPLNDKRHPDHFKPYVQDYLREYGVRKVESDALLKVPEIGRELCRQAILKYVPANAAAALSAKLTPVRANCAASSIACCAGGGRGARYDRKPAPTTGDSTPAPCSPIRLVVRCAIAQGRRPLGLAALRLHDSRCDRSSAGGRMGSTRCVAVPVGDDADVAAVAGLGRCWGRTPTVHTVTWSDA